MGDDGPTSKAVGDLFNGISIGFKPPQVVEGLIPFENALDDYSKWASASKHWTTEMGYLLFFPAFSLKRPSLDCTVLRTLGLR